MLKPKEIDQIKNYMDEIRPVVMPGGEASLLSACDALLAHIEERWPDGIRKPQDVWLVCDNEVGVQYLSVCPGFSDFSLSEEGANGFISKLKLPNEFDAGATCHAVKYVPVPPPIEGGGQ